MRTTGGEIVLPLPSYFELQDLTADQQAHSTVTSLGPNHYTLHKGSNEENGFITGSNGSHKQLERCFLCKERFTNGTLLQEIGYRAVKTESEDLVNFKQEEVEVSIGHSQSELHPVKLEEEEFIRQRWEMEAKQVKEEEEELMIPNGNVQVTGMSEYQVANIKNEELIMSVKKEEAEEEAITKTEEMLFLCVTQKEAEGALIKVEEIFERNDVLYNYSTRSLANPNIPEFGNGADCARTMNKPSNTDRNQQATAKEDLVKQEVLRDHNYFSSSMMNLVPQQKHGYYMRSSVRNNKNSYCISGPVSNRDSSENDQRCKVSHDHQYSPTQRPDDYVALKQVPAFEMLCSAKNFIPPISDSDTDTAEDTTKRLDNKFAEEMSENSNSNLDASKDASDSSEDIPESSKVNWVSFHCLLDHDYIQEYAPQKAKKNLSKQDSSDHSDSDLSEYLPPKNRTSESSTLSSESDSCVSKKSHRRLRRRRKWKSRLRKKPVQEDLHSKKSPPISVGKDATPVAGFLDGLQLCTRCGKLFSTTKHTKQQLQCPSCSRSEALSENEQLLLQTQEEVPPLVKYLCADCQEFFPNHKAFTTHRCCMLKVINGGFPAPFIQPNNKSYTILNYGSSWVSVVRSAKPPLNGQSLFPTFSIVNINHKLPTVQNSNVPTITNSRLVPVLPRVPVQDPSPLPHPIHVIPLTPSSTFKVSFTKSTPPQLDLHSHVSPPPQHPVKVLGMFVNQSQELALQKRLYQSWKKKAVFLCRHCGVMSRQPSLCIRHRYQHRGPRPHKCQCGRAFQQRLHLLRHQIQHAETTRYVCATCGRTFHGTQHLAWHNHKALKSVPSHNRCRNFFPCQCGQTFPRPSALLWHMLKSSEARKSCLRKSSFS